MRRSIIIITESGEVSIPNNEHAPIKMKDFEIAELLGVMLPTVRSHIKSILKSGAISGDLRSGTVVGNIILPDYYGLDMVVSIAFRMSSYKADIFRKYVVKQLTSPPTTPLYICINSKQNGSIIV